jgi:hypothetical protein
MFGRPSREQIRKPHATGRPGSLAGARRARRRFTLEPLEDRLLPSLDLTKLAPGVDQILTALQTQINNNIYAVNMPIIGTGLSSDPADAKFLTALDNTFQGALAPFAPPAPPPSMAAVQSAIGHALGTNVGELQNDPAANVEFQVTIAPPATPLGETFAFQPGLLLGLTNMPAGIVHASVGYNFTFAFGEDATGVYLDASQSSLSVTVTANLQGFAGGATFVGALPVQVADGPSALQGLPALSPSQFQGTFTVGMGSGTIYASSVGGSSMPVNFQPASDTHIDLGIALDTSSLSQDFPSIGGNLVIDWPMTGGPVTGTQLPGDGAGTGGKPTVSLNHLGITNLDAFFANFLQPIYQPLNEFLSPIKPILNFLESPLPVLSDAFGITVTPLDFLGVDRHTNDFIKAVDNIINRNLPADAGLQGELDFGSFQLDAGPDLRKTDLGSLAAQLSGTQSMSALMQNLAQEVSNDLTSLLPGTLSVPLLDPNQGPGILLGTLLGQKETLFTYTTPSFGFSQDVPIVPLTEPGIEILPPFPIFLQLKPSIGVSASLSIGYDTHGLTESHPNPLDGFYFYNPSGGPASGITLTGEVKGDVTGNVAIIEVGGGADLTVNLGLGLDIGRAGYFDTLPDGTHVVRFNNLADMIAAHGPLALFDIQGSADVSLNYYYRVGIPPLGFQIDQDFGDLTLFNFNFDPWTTAPGQPELADYVDPTNPTALEPSHQVNNPANADIIAPDNPANTTLRLNLGDYVSSRHVGLGEPEEDYEITPVPDPITGKNKPNAVDITAFGVTQEYDNVTKIEAYGNTYNSVDITTENISIESGVTADAELHGGGFAPLVNKGGVVVRSFQKNTFRYLGSGTGNLFGGDLASNYLYGGPGTNNLAGSNIGALEANDPTKASNHLFGGSGTHSTNTLTGGDADAVLVAGGEGSANTLNAGPGTTDPKTGAFYAADYYLIAGQGSTVMNGNAGMNYYQWQEGDGPLTVTGTNPESVPYNNELTVTGGSQGGETWTVSSPARDVVQVHGQKASGDIITVTAFGLQTVSIDNTAGESNQNINPGGNTYNVDDLSGTGIGYVNVNQHASVQPDQNADHIFVIGSEPGDEAYISTNGPSTNVRLRNPGRRNPAGGLILQKDYAVYTSIPGPGDVLTVHTQGGSAQVNVGTTQAQGTTNILTDAGNNLVYVGPTLDGILGPLSIDVGTGSNELHFDNSQSAVVDTLALSATQLIRYVKETGTVVGTNPVPETAFPLVINYKATGGNLNNGLLLDTSFGGTSLYIPSLPAGAPTTVTAHSSTGDPSDAITVGYDGANPNAPANAASLGILAQIASPLTVTGKLGWHTDLVVDDQGSTQAEGYSVTGSAVVRINPPTVVIDYSNIDELTLDAASSQNNSILVNSTAAATHTTVNAGNGDNTVLVGGQFVHRIDGILGPLAVNGGSGIDSLTIDDSTNGSAQSYGLTATNFTRTGPPAILISYAQISSLSFYASQNTGSNNITVTGTPAGVPVTISPGGGNAALTVGTLDNVQGPLTFQWVTGSKTLLVQDSTAAENAIYQVLPDQIQRIGAAAIRFKYTSSGPPATSDPLASIKLAAGQVRGAEVDVPATIAATPVTLSLGAANNQVVVSGGQQDLDSLQGQLAIQGVGTTTAILDDQKGPAGRNYLLGAAALQFNPSLAPIQLSSLSGVTLNAANASKASVSATAAGQPVTLNLGTGPNAVTVGSPSQQLQPIQAPLIVNGHTGTNQLTLRDQGTPFSSLAYTLTPNSVSRPGVSVNYSHMTAVQLDGSPGLIAYQVQGVDPTTQVSLLAAGLSTNTLAGPNTANNWQITGRDTGTLDASLQFINVGYLLGGAGNDTFTVLAGATLSSNLNGGGGSNTLVGPNTTCTWSIFSNNEGALVSALLFSSIQNLTGGTGSNTFNLDAGGSLSGTLTGGGGTNTLVGPNTTNTWSISGTNAGNLDGIIAFTSVQNLTGGTALDAFIFGAGAGVTGKIDGGGGGDWLDYAAYTTPVTVNLPTDPATGVGTATGVGGGIAHIQDVRGGQGGNTLTGNAQGNILIGGAGADTITGGPGRNILIGDKGADTITAGAGDTILIGGYTDYDSSSLAHDQALESILAEWQSSNPYALRISHIKFGGGLNGPNLLAWGVTVHDDGSANTLIDGAGMDWFFAGALDTIKNLKPGEQVN